MQFTVQEHRKQWLCGLKEEFRVFAQGERSVGKEKRLQVAVGLRWLARRTAKEAHLKGLMAWPTYSSTMILIK